MMANLQSRKHRLLGVDETKNLEQAVNDIVYNTPTSNGNGQRHILQALVTDEPGVLRSVSFPKHQQQRKKCLKKTKRCLFHFSQQGVWGVGSQGVQHR